MIVFVFFQVAIKIIDTRKLKEDYSRNNLHREARILGQIRHPHIIRLYETLKVGLLLCYRPYCIVGKETKVHRLNTKNPSTFVKEDRNIIFLIIRRACYVNMCTDKPFPELI